MDEQKGSWGKPLAAILPIGIGLAASAMLLVDYVRPAPVFCDASAGCASLKHTIYAAFLGVPTPAWGVLGFVAMGALALQRGARVRMAHAIVATIAAIVGGFLLTLQARFGVWCKFCCVVDASALAACGVAWWRVAGKWDGPGSIRSRASYGGALAIALVLPIVVGMRRESDVPAVIAKELADSPGGVVTVVDFVDFECPFCRMTHADLEPLLASHAKSVRVVRRQVPLEHIHPHALAAARAACCGESMGKGDAMADALFEAPLDDLTADGCAKLAASLGLDESAFRACMQDPKTNARIEADRAEFKDAKGRGLPLLWIGEEKIEGAVGPEALERAMTSAIARRS